MFAIAKEGRAGIWRTQEGRSLVHFPISAVTASDKGTYRCYGFDSHFPYLWTAPSEALELRVIGMLFRPTLKADSGPLIPRGTAVTLRCKGHPGATWYGLKKGESQSQNMTRVGMEAQFNISSMTKDTAGSYCCLYKSQSSLSEPSEPLELVMTGLYDKPLLSVVPSQEVVLGQNVTLSCQDEKKFDRFAFCKREGANTSCLQSNGSQQNFSIPVVTAAHVGIYWCYAFHSQHPYLWTAPSGPVDLRVTVPGTSAPRPQPLDVIFGFSRFQVGILIGFLALLILVSLIFLSFFLLRCQQQRQAKLRTGGKEADVEETLRSQAEDASPESPYAVVKGIQLDEHRKPNVLVEDPQEVTYAHLIHKTPSQHLERLPPFPPGESIVYAPLAIQEASYLRSLVTYLDPWLKEEKLGFFLTERGIGKLWVELILSLSCVSVRLSDPSPLSQEAGSTMPPLVITLLGFGLWLSQWIRAQEGPLPRPTLQAHPGPLIPWKKSVTLQCQGFPGAEAYRLRKEGSSQFTEMATTGREAKFPISSVTPDTTGSYHCLYRNQFNWSKPSEPLELVMTGWYDKPSLSALPHPEVFLGENVTLQCRSQQWFEKYALHKEGEAKPSQSQGEWYHADFHILGVTAAHGGSYRCYTFHRETPYEWSAPSNLLELKIKDASPKNYTVSNLIRLGLAGLVLIILGGLLVEACYSQRKHREAARKHRGAARKHRGAARKPLPEQSRVEMQ
ncbi:leukocyte immunoglobulin-like receptor subfamily A member 2 [Dromiciops gliroides]|uniref:leukocyte immunoglobulin-like receptor subfamily A member 2 n=1 Tax=Dromiciops gliroides TaxID=33562 RepID=UPI001CC50461|nr:leukocyte immunoglobulin-like receptor subfamily A member 2 [Dromiciops gliroides]